MFFGNVKFASLKKKPLLISKEKETGDLV